MMQKIRKAREKKRSASLIPIFLPLLICTYEACNKLYELPLRLSRRSYPLEISITSLIIVIGYILFPLNDLALKVILFSS